MWNIFTVDFSHLLIHFTEESSGNYFVKSVVRISQLISQENVWGINCEIQGVSTVIQASQTIIAERNFYLPRF